MVNEKVERQNKSIEKLFKKLNIKEDESITYKEIIDKNNKYIYHPKRPCSAYIFFSKKERINIKDKNPEMKFGDIAKTIGINWKQISEKDKKKYIKMADEDKIRYNKEMEEYKKKINF